MKQRIERRKIDPVYFSRKKINFPVDKIEIDKRKPMKTRIIKFVRDTVAGLVGGGATFALTGDITAAVIIGSGALLLALGMDFEVVKKFMTFARELMKPKK